MFLAITLAVQHVRLHNTLQGCKEEDRVPWLEAMLSMQASWLLFGSTWEQQTEYGSCGLQHVK